jgi:hypothetical protein
MTITGGSEVYEKTTGRKTKIIGRTGTGFLCS